jgi:hypothetical protein
MTEPKLKIALTTQIDYLKKLSTENLIIWIIGKSNDANITLTSEDIVLECWLVNPEKHSMRKYPQFPDSSVVIKRIGEMKGKKGLLLGSEMGGYNLTEVSKIKYADICEFINRRKIVVKKGIKIADRKISSIDEAPYNRLLKTPAYRKFIEHKLEQIVETDFLYFYGVNWHSKISFIINRIKNTDSIVEKFSIKNPKLKELKLYINNKFSKTKDFLLKK